MSDKPDYARITKAEYRRIKKLFGPQVPRGYRPVNRFSAKIRTGKETKEPLRKTGIFLKPVGRAAGEILPNVSLSPSAMFFSALILKELRDWGRVLESKKEELLHLKHVSDLIHRHSWPLGQEGLNALSDTYIETWRSVHHGEYLLLIQLLTILLRPGSVSFRSTRRKKLTPDLALFIMAALYDKSYQRFRAEIRRFLQAGLKTIPRGYTGFSFIMGVYGGTWSLASIHKDALAMGPLPSVDQLDPDGKWAPSLEPVAKRTSSGPAVLIIPRR